MRKLVPRIHESKYRGLKLSKLSHASLSQEETVRVLETGAAFKPNQILEELEKISSTVANPSLSVLSVLSERAAASFQQFYPPQILRTLQLFSQISFCDSKNMFLFLASRKSDLLLNASPKRVVLLLEAITRLNLPLFHESIWPELRAELVRVIPQLKRGVPNVLASLARAGSCAHEDLEIIEALLVQAECVKAELEPEFFVKSIEAASRTQGSSQMVSRAIEVGKFEGAKKVSARSATYLLTAAGRSGIIGKEMFLEKILQFLNNDSNSLFEKARLVEVLARFGIRGNDKLSESVAACIEKGLCTSADFSHKFLPHTLLSASVIGGPAASKIVGYSISSLVENKRIDRLSAEKLLALLRAAKITGNETVAEEIIMKNLTTVARQLTLRQARCLWEVAPGISPPLSALPPLTRRGKESDVIEMETVGPYNLLRGAPNEFLLPKFQVMRPDFPHEVRPDALLKISAINKSQVDAVFSHSF